MILGQPPIVIVGSVIFGVTLFIIGFVVMKLRNK